MRVRQPVGDSLPTAGGQPEPSFGSLLRTLRLRARLTQEVLAERAGVSVATIEALEGDRRRQPYPHTVAALAEALGLGPDERAALQAAVPLREQAAEPAPTSVATPPRPRVRLPVPPTPLIGRDAEVAAAAARLDPARSAVRMLTLTGPGGVGKTRLALAAASTLIDAYDDGVVFVDLAPVRDQRLVPATIAHALDVRESGGRSARDLLLDYLRERHLLLVLDNFEHLLGAASLLAELLQGCPRLALLVTSRTALRLRPEQRFEVAPLPPPGAEEVPSVEAIAASPAVRLFVQRAQAIVPDFVLDPGNARAVGAICRQLEGIPLAIELAAARAGLLRPEALLRRLERRLPELTAGAADLPERQRTLRATLAWSYDLLGPRGQALLRRLAVFARDWTLEAAEAVCSGPGLGADEVLESLQTLIGSSLVQVIERDSPEQRFRMLELIAEYARDQLEASGEADLVRTRHRDWYVSWVERMPPYVTGPDQIAWYGCLEQELDNLRAARAWSRADPSGPESELRLAGALGRFWHIRAPGAEGRAWLTEALARGPKDASAARASALIWCGQLEYVHGNPEAGLELLAKAADVARGLPDKRAFMLALRFWALHAPDLGAARSTLEEVVSVARGVGDQRELAFALSLLGTFDESRGDLATAEQRYAEAVAAARTARDSIAIADALLRLGGLATTQASFARSGALLEEALALVDALGYRMYTSQAMRLLAELALAEGDLSRAQAWIQASLRIVRESGRGADALFPVRVAARVVARQGAAHRAVRLYAAEVAWRTEHGLRGQETLWALYAVPRADEDLTQLRAEVGEQAFAALWADGLRVPLADALDEALAVTANPG